MLHHDILRVLSQQNLLQNLTFIGGTCLRSCYGASRLSEDLDFTGGASFTEKSLNRMGEVLVKDLTNKYGMKVSVSAPTKDLNNVDTWKIKVETRPEQKNFPAQRINIDVCKVSSYDKRPMMLLNPYGIDMGTSGLIINAESREEIYTDKLLSFALRPNRIKYRDLWDIIWLNQQAIKPQLDLVIKKLSERKLAVEEFSNIFEQRRQSLITNPSLEVEFHKEMQRFLPVEQVNEVLQQKGLWSFITSLLGDLIKPMRTNNI